MHLKSISHNCRIFYFEWHSLWLFCLVYRIYFPDNCKSTTANFEMKVISNENYTFNLFFRSESKKITWHLQFVTPFRKNILFLFLNTHRIKFLRMLHFLKILNKLYILLNKTVNYSLVVFVCLSVCEKATINLYVRVCFFKQILWR